MQDKIQNQVLFRYVYYLSFTLNLSTTVKILCFLSLLAGSGFSDIVLCFWQVPNNSNTKKYLKSILQRGISLVGGTAWPLIHSSNTNNRGALASLSNINWIKYNQKKSEVKGNVKAEWLAEISKKEPKRNDLLVFVLYHISRSFDNTKKNDTNTRR